MWPWPQRISYKKPTDSHRLLYAERSECGGRMSWNVTECDVVFMLNVVVSMAECTGVKALLEGCLGADYPFSAAGSLPNQRKNMHPSVTDGCE